jgi:pimeloyl-ACP methyl ester carboxylesterase
MKTYSALLATLFLTSPLALFADEPFPVEPIHYPAFTLHSLPVGKDGRVNALIMTPEKPLPGNPWVLGTFQDVRNAAVANMTRTQLELVRRGFHVVGASPGVVLGAPDPNAVWDTVYDVMTTKLGLSKRVALMGLSREGLTVARWAAANPGKVSAIYMDHAVCDFKSWPGGKLGIGPGSKNDWATLQKVYNFKDEAEALAFQENPVDLAPKLIADKVAIIYVAGEKDNYVPYSENGARMQQQYDKLGGTFLLIMSAGVDHHPHGLSDPTPVVDFVEKHAR